MHEVENSYLRNAFSALAPESSSAQFYEQLFSIFPEQTCFPLPPSDASSFEKRIEKLSRTLLESGRNRYLKGVLLNGPLLSSILVSMLAHRPNPFKVQIDTQASYPCVLIHLANSTVCCLVTLAGIQGKDLERHDPQLLPQHCGVRHQNVQVAHGRAAWEYRGYS